MKRSTLDYRVVLLEETPCPKVDFCPPGDGERRWHRYVIRNRVNSITGFRTGRTDEVAAHAAECAHRLNARYRASPV